VDIGTVANTKVDISLPLIILNYHLWGLGREILRATTVIENKVFNIVDLQT
jgi:hypothetical protein